MTVVVFAPVAGHAFVSVDDHIYITETREVLRGLTWQGVGWAFTTGYANFWHPLTWLSLMLDVQLFGSSPGALHLTNLLFHLANTFFLFLLLRRMTDAPLPSALVAGLFAVHPLHVESVAWVSERKDVLSTFFLMLMLWAYANYARGLAGRGRSRAAFAAVAILFALGLMAKPMLVTVPFGLLLFDWWPLGRVGAASIGAEGSGRARAFELWSRLAPLVWEKVPLFVLAAVASVVAFLAQARGGAVASLDSFSLSGRVANALTSYVAYIGKSFWPATLVPFYPYPQGVRVWTALGALLVLVAVTAAVVAQARRRPYLAVGWFWYLGTLLPVSGLVQVGSHAMADRYTYLPLVGIFVMIVWSAFEWVAGRRARRTVAVAVACGVLAALAVTARAQVMTWRDSVTLWQHAVRVMPSNYYAHNALGLELKKAGRMEEAAAHFAEASRLATGFPNSHGNLGQVLAEQGRIDEAIAEYRMALERAPDYVQAHINLGNALQSAGRLDEALTHYSEAIRHEPGSATARLNLATALLEAGRPDEALAQNREALALRPESAAGPLQPREHPATPRAPGRGGRALPGRPASPAGSRCRGTAHQPGGHPRSSWPPGRGTGPVRRGAARGAGVAAGRTTTAGSSLAQQGRTVEAAAEYGEALRSAPTFAEAHMNLGNALADLGRLDEAEREHRRAVQLDPRSPSAHFNLADTLRRLGRLEEALVHCEETLRLEGPSADVHEAMAETLEKLGRPREAAAHYEEALRLDPRQAQAAAGLARLSGPSGRKQDR